MPLITMHFIAIFEQNHGEACAPPVLPRRTIRWYRVLSPKWSRSRPNTKAALQLRDFGSEPGGFSCARTHVGPVHNLSVKGTA